MRDSSPCMLSVILVAGYLTGSVMVSSRGNAFGNKRYTRGSRSQVHKLDCH